MGEPNNRLPIYGNASFGPANRHAANDVPGGWGNCTRTQCQERKHRASVPPFPHPRTNVRHAMLRPRYQHLTTNAAATACGGRAMRCAADVARHGQRVRPRPGPVVRSCFSDAARDRSTDYIQINIYQRPRERGPIYAQRKHCRAAAPRGPGRGKWWQCGAGARKVDAGRAIGAAVGPDRSGRGAGCPVAGRDAARVRKS